MPDLIGLPPSPTDWTSKRICPSSKHDCITLCACFVELGIGAMVLPSRLLLTRSVLYGHYTPGATCSRSVPVIMILHLKSLLSEA